MRGSRYQQSALEKRKALKEYFMNENIISCKLVLQILLNCVLCMLKMCLHVSVPCVHTCSHANVSCMVTCSRTNVLQVLRCLTCQHALCAYALCQHVNVACELTYSQDNMPCVPCLRRLPWGRDQQPTCFASSVSSSDYTFFQFHSHCC